MLRNSNVLHQSELRVNLREKTDTLGFLKSQKHTCFGNSGYCDVCKKDMHSDQLEYSYN